MSSRGLSDDRAAKRDILAKIAARRKQQSGASGAGPRRTILGLSDSDSSDDEGYARGPADGEEGGKDEPSTAVAPPTAPFAPPSQALLSRLTKAPKAAISPGDLTSQLGALGLGRTASSSSSSNNGPTAPPARPPPQPTAQRVQLHKQGHPTAPPPSKHLIPAKQAAAPAGTDSSTSSSSQRASKAGGAASTEGCLVLGDSGEFVLSAELSSKLYAHQVVGLRWLWGLHKVSAGGILADDMGLGKTMQVSAFLSGLLRNRLIRRALVLAPKTLLAAWNKELDVCGIAGDTQEYGGTPAERQRALQRVLGGGGVLIASYGMVQHNSRELGQWSGHDADEGPLWDLMVMDEGHKLKNPKTVLRAHVESLPVRCRLLVSGTPIQNNLMEMHALFDLVRPGLLGGPKAFKDRFERRITLGSDKHATQGERERGASAAAELRQTIAPFFLRREKKEVFAPAAAQGEAAAAAGGVGVGNGHGSVSSSAGEGSSAAPAASTTGPSPGAMGHKNDLVVWLRLQANQRALYESFLHSDSVKAALNQTSSALAALTVLKKICDHPALCSERAQRGIIAGAHRAARQQQHGVGDSSSDDGEGQDGGSDGEDSGSECDSASSGEDRQPVASFTGELPNVIKGATDSGSKQRGKARRKRAADAAAAVAAAPPPAEWLSAWAGSGMDDRILGELHTTGFEASCKTLFVMALLRHLVGAGHRTLVFSQSRVMLDILQAAIVQERWRFCRVDGSVASAAERQARVESFQTDPSVPVFLLTSQVGGLGLTLTAADRVIILDPAWNPSVDNQSVDRAYRIGQQRDVVVYRLISCGTVEDKIYRRQVAKGGLSRTGTEDGEQFRYFSAAELRDLLRLDPAEANASSTQRQLAALHKGQRRETPELTAHLAFLATLDGFAGVSDHDLLYTKKEAEGPAGAARFGTAPPEAATLAPFASPSHRPRGPRAPVIKPASQGWSGGGGISDMFARALTLGGTASAPNASAPNASAPTVSAPKPTPSAEDAARQRLADLQLAMAKQHSILSNPRLVAGLPDGGHRIRASIAEAQAKVNALCTAHPTLAAEVQQQQQGEQSNVAAFMPLAAGRPAAAEHYLLPQPPPQQHSGMWPHVQQQQPPPPPQQQQQQQPMGGWQPPAPPGLNHRLAPYSGSAEQPRSAVGPALPPATAPNTQPASPAPPLPTAVFSKPCEAAEATEPERVQPPAFLSPFAKLRAGISGLFGSPRGAESSAAAAAAAPPFGMAALVDGAAPGAAGLASPEGLAPFQPAKRTFSPVANPAAAPPAPRTAPSAHVGPLEATTLAAGQSRTLAEQAAPLQVNFQAALENRVPPESHSEAALGKRVKAMKRELYQLALELAELEKQPGAGGDSARELREKIEGLNLQYRDAKAQLQAR